jgi:flagellar protein FliJ
MKRSQRLQMVQQVVDDNERRRAERFAASEKRVAECEAKLAELESYQASYARDFTVRAGQGIGAVGLRDYQTFLARLGEAVRQQNQLLSRARAERDAERENWQGAAQRAEAVGQIVKRWQGEEQRALDRQEQLESDERAQRNSHRTMSASKVTPFDARVESARGDFRQDR